MRTVQPENPEPFDLGQYTGYRLTWKDMTGGDEGAWLKYPHYPEKTISIEGELRDGGLEGANAAGGQFFPLVDSEGKLINRSGLYVLKLNPMFIRPVVRDGDHVTVHIICTR